ncbi:MoxR family ATPase [Microbacterium sp. B19]|uniref:AAA family ATPase n=1 Tax=Microbacterium sp. B19 TaxID=96765 RepID=UPI00034CBA29|nr:MoxR family ATPase [Microbacterium sp. B19]
MIDADLPHGFTSPDDVATGLRATGYLPDADISTTVFLASALEKPLLLEGPAGTGKTDLAASIARTTGARLIRLQCYHGIDEARALYEWDYRKQLLALQAAGTGPDASLDGVFSEDFLLSRPLLEAVRAEDRVVLLIDEVDQLDMETEALLLEFLADFQVTIPELGTMRAARAPLVFLTSNDNRRLSDALKRRCLYLHISYPDAERESEIIRSRVPGIDERLSMKIAETVAMLRGLDLKKRPSISESIDWARTLLLLGATDIDEDLLIAHANVLLKYASDIDLARETLGVRT